MKFFISSCCAGLASDGYDAAIVCSNVHPARPSCSTSGGQFEAASVGAVGGAAPPEVALKKSRNELHDRHL